MTKLTETQNRILAVSTIEAKTLGYIAAKLDMTTNQVHQRLTLKLKTKK